MKIFLIIANTRSGSTIVCDTAYNYLDSEVAYEFYYDIYKDNSRINKYFMAWIQKKYSEDWLGFLQSDPVMAISELIQYSKALNRKYLFLKIFNDQLSKNDIEDLFTYLSNNHDLSIIFISRKRIDCLISHEKAIATNSFHYIDSTENKLEVGYYQIKNRSGEIDDWYSYTHNLASKLNIQHYFMVYDKNIANGKIDILKFFINIFSIKESEIKNRNMIKESFKQDLEVDWQNKVLNGAELMSLMIKDNAVEYFENSFCDAELAIHNEICGYLK